MIEIYTDGACSGNPGPGAYSLVLYENKKEIKNFSKAFHETTNNRMELMAVIKALMISFNHEKGVIYSDSAYVVNSINKGWVWDWGLKGFKGKKNIDLWERFLELLPDERGFLNYSFDIQWVKGHHVSIGNERADELAVKAVEKSKRINDTGFLNKKNVLS